MRCITLFVCIQTIATFHAFGTTVILIQAQHICGIRHFFRSSIIERNIIKVYRKFKFTVFGDGAVPTEDTVVVKTEYHQVIG